MNRYQHGVAEHSFQFQGQSDFSDLKPFGGNFQLRRVERSEEREGGMHDSGAILCQISALKDMLDKVNEEIEANIQTTREIESEIVKCDEIETALKARESELMKLLYLSQFELSGLMVVAGRILQSHAYNFKGALLVMNAMN